MKYLLTLALVVLFATAASMAFAASFVALEYDTTLTPTAVPVPNADSVAPFPDVPMDTNPTLAGNQTFWAWAQIIECTRAVSESSDFVVQGFLSGEYGPGVVVSRGAMAVFISRAKGYTDTVDPLDPTFPDVPADYWAFADIERTVFNGVVKGYADGLYRPATDVTRDQMAVYIQRAAGFATAPVTTAPFHDVGTGFWAAPEIQACVANEVVTGYADGNYFPANAVTRDQMAVFVWRALERNQGFVVLGGLWATTDFEPATPGGAQLFYPDDLAGATTAADASFAVGSNIILVLDAVQAGSGNVVIELDDPAIPALPAPPALEDTETIALNAATLETAVNDANGLPYAVISYDLPAAASATTVLTFELPNGAVLTFPVAPTGLSASAASTTAVSLGWNENADTGVTYSLYRSTTAGFTPSSGNRIANGLSFSGTGVAPNYTDSGRTHGTTYYYKVTASKWGSTSLPSAQASATP